MLHYALVSAGFVLALVLLGVDLTHMTLLVSALGVGKGKFDQGWDKYREETLARQTKLVVVPPGTKLAPRPQLIKARWQALH